MKRLQIFIFTLFAAGAVSANPLDSLAIKPIEKLQSAIVVDTLPTADKSLSIVLFNDNSWRYIRTAEIEPDSTAFTRYWSTEKISPYREVALSSIPSATAIELVDSLRSYHYPITGRITSRYGLRRRVNHNGIDIAAEAGTPVCAAADGVVYTTYTDEQGLTGLEKKYDDILTGTAGRKVTLTDRDGNALSEDNELYYPAEEGQSLVLTIDEVLQHFLEKNLEVVLDTTHANHALL